MLCARQYPTIIFINTLGIRKQVHQTELCLPQAHAGVQTTATRCWNSQEGSLPYSVHNVFYSSDIEQKVQFHPHSLFMLHEGFFPVCLIHKNILKYGGYKIWIADERTLPPWKKMSLPNHALSIRCLLSAERWGDFLGPFLPSCCSSSGSSSSFPLHQHWRLRL